MSTEHYPKSYHIDDITFTPTSYHHNEYELQKTYAEEILRVPWLLTFNEWCQFFIGRQKLRDHPPVTTHMWARRIKSNMPFMTGNLSLSPHPEHCRLNPTSEKYKLNTDSEWVTCKRFPEEYL